MDRPSAAPVPASEWLPRPAWRVAAKFGHHALVWGGLVVLWVGGMQAARSWGLPGLLGIVIVLPVLYLNAAVHELGHLFAARRAGMFVVRAQVGSVELQARRRRWHARWRAPRVRVDGLVMAFPDPHRPMQAQLLAFAAGGPMANLATGAMLVAFAAAGWHDWLGSVGGWLILGSGICAMAIGTANLMPVVHGVMASDGLQLLRFRRGIDEEVQALAFMRANGLAMTGVGAHELPGTLLDRLASGPPPMRLFKLWIALFAHLNRGEWQQAARLGPAFEAQLAALPAAQRPGWTDFENVVRAEMRFAAALAGDDDLAGVASTLPADNDWYRPAQRPRFLALAAALAGDIAGCHRALADAERAGEDSADGASRRTEAILRAAIVEVLHTRATSLPAA